MRPILAAFALILPLTAAEKPNVILIMTDDQGYGDIAAHGHPHLKTPNMDRLRREGVRLENFHVDPTCSPTRAALMTGRYSGRVGVWHTINPLSPSLRSDSMALSGASRRKQIPSSNHEWTRIHTNWYRTIRPSPVPGVF